MTSLQTVDLFLQERPRLFALAYGFLGSRADAADAVQEAWIRWQGREAEAVREPAAWLTTVTARLALDRLRSAQVRRETYPGTWLPEPIVDAPSAEESAVNGRTASDGRSVARMPLSLVATVSSGIPQACPISPMRGW